MSAALDAELDRRGFLGLVGGVALAYVAGRVLLGGLSLPGLGEVDTTTEHAPLEHGLADVAAVLSAARKVAIEAPEFFRKQDPCDDGFWRLIVPVDAAHEGLLVLVESAQPGMLRMVTAFVVRKRSRYLQRVREDCHGGGPALAA